MGRKQKQPDHENLERWLVSYGDFITLLFATFVVLYALAQTDISEFSKLEEAMQKAFSSSLLQGRESVLDSQGTDMLNEASFGDSIIAPLMMEYMSNKYEEDSYKEIEATINKMKKDKELDGIDVEITDKGLVIKLENDNLYNPGSATLTEKAKKTLEKVGIIIAEKFVFHQMRIEGHTDNQPISTSVFPSNWELSSARASAVIRYFISKFKYSPNLFTAVGYADTKPVVSNNNSSNRAKNRRIEILILKNKFKKQENDNFDLMKMTKKEQIQLHQDRIEALNKVKNISGPIKAPDAPIVAEEEPVKIKLNKSYMQESERIKQKVEPIKKDIIKTDDWLKAPAGSGSKAIREDIRKEFAKQLK